MHHPVCLIFNSTMHHSIMFVCSCTVQAMEDDKSVEWFQKKALDRKE